MVFISLIELPDDKQNSTQTYGVRFTGATERDWGKIHYTAEYAKQNSYKDGDSGIDGDYWHLVGGLTARGVTGTLGYEVLGADDFSGFETPFATKHAFNGWADIFLNTPTDGLRDAYFALGGNISGVELKGIYHDFRSDRGSSRYGQELDLSVTYSFLDHYKVGMIYANYDADELADDTQKLWIWGSLNF